VGGNCGWIAYVGFDCFRGLYPQVQDTMVEKSLSSTIGPLLPFAISFWVLEPSSRPGRFNSLGDLYAQNHIARSKSGRRRLDATTALSFPSSEVTLVAKESQITHWKL